VLLLATALLLALAAVVLIAPSVGASPLRGRLVAEVRWVPKPSPPLWLAGAALLATAAVTTLRTRRRSSALPKHPTGGSAALPLPEPLDLDPDLLDADPLDPEGAGAGRVPHLYVVGGRGRRQVRERAAGSSPSATVLPWPDRRRPPSYDPDLPGGA
jgi:hypothetical protein